MTAIVERRIETDIDVLPPELLALIPSDAPAFVSPGWIREHLGVLPQTVTAAVRDGRIAALTVHGGKQAVAAYALRPEDAVRLWGMKIIRRRARLAAEKTKEI